MSIHIIFCTHWKSHVAVYTCSAAGALRALRRQLRSPAFASTEEGSLGSAVSESSSSGPEGRSSQFVRRSRGEREMCHVPIADHTRSPCSPSLPHCCCHHLVGKLQPPLYASATHHIMYCRALPALPNPTAQA
jgi:hypothetical protein